MTVRGGYREGHTLPKVNYSERRLQTVRKKLWKVTMNNSIKKEKKWEREREF